MERIAILGAGGTMGFAMARNLTRAGYDIRAWNRSREKAQPLSDDGATVTDTAAQAIEGADIVLTMLADADAVLSSVDGALPSGADAIWLQMSTIGEQGTARCAEVAREHGVAFVDAPVVGTKQPAQEGKLIVLASGPEQLRDRLDPIFDVVGQRTMWVGEAGMATRLKVAVNAWLVTVVEGGAETLALAEGLGLDPQLVLDVLGGGPLDLPYLQMKGKAMIERSFDPSFRLALAAKDAGLVQESASEHGLELPVLAAIAQRMREGIPEHGDKDMSATFLTSAKSS